MSTLSELLQKVTNVRHFNSLQRYRDFCLLYLGYIESGLQARIVSQNENQYQFFQYGRDGKFNISRPINTSLFCTGKDFAEKLKHFNSTFLSGHFRAYTIRLTPMDGVYYCDIRPNMVTDPFLSQHIRTIDHLFFTELHQWVDS